MFTQDPKKSTMRASGKFFLAENFDGITVAFSVTVFDYSL